MAEGSKNSDKRIQWHLGFVSAMQNELKEGMLFGLQIIVTRELETEKHIWLRALSKDLEKQEIVKLINKVDGLTEKQEKECADAILQICIKANEKTIEELKEEAEKMMCDTLMRIMEPEITQRTDEARREGRQVGLREGRQEVKEEALLILVETLKEMGADRESIHNILVSKGRLTSDEAERLMAKSL